MRRGTVAVCHGDEPVGWVENTKGPLQMCKALEGPVGWVWRTKGPLWMCEALVGPMGRVCVWAERRALILE